MIMPIEILMPALSPTMTEGTLAKWNKKEGDSVSAGEVIAEIETDKATMEVEAVDEGVLGKIIVQGGSEGVKVNAVIALLLADGEDKKVLKNWKPKPEEKAETAEDTATDSGKSSGKKTAPQAAGASVIAAQASIAPDAPALPENTGGANVSGRLKASPLAKRIAQQQGVDLSNVVGTGPHGRITSADLEGVKRGGGLSGGSVSRNAQEMFQVPHTSMRKVIAKRLLESKQQVPHFYLTVECEIDALLDFRKQLNADAAAKAGKDGKPAYRLSVNDLVIKASALALRDKPECNASWYDDAMIRYSNVDISVAVATDSGLITPIIRNADQKTLPVISAEMKDLAKRARINKLKPEEFQGGGFSISNLGMFGVQQFNAIINPPQSCILAVGAGEQVVKVKDGEMRGVNVIKISLAVDHRAVDGALGAQWLQAFKHYIEQPVLMLV
jgi:pyruvate dehydrogenase E2 component (dihydrolipoamide acetyltransferase)